MLVMYIIHLLNRQLKLSAPPFCVYGFKTQPKEKKNKQKKTKMIRLENSSKITSDSRVD